MNVLGWIRRNEEPVRDSGPERGFMIGWGSAEPVAHGFGWDLGLHKCAHHMCKEHPCLNFLLLHMISKQSKENMHSRLQFSNETG